MRKPFLAIFSFLLFSCVISAQETNDNFTRAAKGEDQNFLYRNEQSFGLFIHSAGGFGGVYRKAKHVTGTRKKMVEIEMQNFRHPKEVKSASSNFIPNTGYFYGKLNSVLLLRHGVGYQNVIYKKSEKKNVEVRYVTMVGVTLAFAKPVYLYFLDSVDSKTRTSRQYNPAVDTRPELIYGRSPFGDGLNKTKILPAGYVKLGLSFDFAERYDLVKSLEVGVVMDAYPKALKLVAFSRAQNLLFSVYLKMTWGRKWY